MKSIDKHNLPMIGLRKAAAATEDFGPYSDKYYEIFYNRESGQVWAKFQVGLGQNSRTVYDDPAIIKVCNTQQHLTMQQLADMIDHAVAD